MGAKAPWSSWSPGLPCFFPLVLYAYGEVSVSPYNDCSYSHYHLIQEQILMVPLLKSKLATGTFAICSFLAVLINLYI